MRTKFAIIFVSVLVSALLVACIGPPNELTVSAIRLYDPRLSMGGQGLKIEITPNEHTVPATTYCLDAYFGGQRIAEERFQWSSLPRRDLLRYPKVTLKIGVGLSDPLYEWAFSQELKPVSERQSVGDVLYLDITKDGKSISWRGEGQKYKD